MILRLETPQQNYSGWLFPESVHEPAPEFEARMLAT
jgi:hypothetical protein